MVADWVQATPHDAIVFTGDTVNNLESWKPAGEWLASLSTVDLKFAVPGNWLYRTKDSPDEFKDWCRQYGYTALINEGCRIPWEGGVLLWAGVDDYRHRDPDVSRALAKRQDGDFVIFLSHNPDILYLMSPHDADLILCGHTHGGQICLPYIGAVVTSTQLGRKFASGLFQLTPESYMYISRGMGTGNVKIRWNCPPEVTSIELYSATTK